MSLKYLVAGFLLTHFLATTALAQSNSPATDFVVFHSNEFTLLLCMISLLLSAWLGAMLPSKSLNKKDQVEMSTSVKFVTSLLGGFLAFIYCLHQDKSLTLMNPLWVAVAAITLPLSIMTIRDKLAVIVNNLNLPKK